MWKLNIPEWEKKYLYFALAAIGLVLMFSWGQLQFFTSGQLNIGSSYSSAPSDTGTYTASASHANRYLSGNGPSPLRQKRPGFFQGIQRSIARYRAFREIARLQRLAEQTEDPEVRAQIEAEIGDQYAYIIGDDSGARTYYVRAVTRGGTGVLTSRRSFSPENTAHIRLPWFSFGSMARSVGHYFSDANPYDIRTSRVQVLNDAEERAREFEADAAPRSEAGGTDGTGDQEAAGNARAELDMLINDIITDIANRDTRALRSFIPKDGIRCGEDVESSTLYTAAEAHRSLKKKKGPVYDTLVRPIRDRKVRPEQISYILDDAPPIISVGLSYPNSAPEELQKKQQLYLQRTDDRWGIIFVEQ